MRTTHTTPIIKSGWFGRNVSIQLINGKTITGELTEVGHAFIVIKSNRSEIQVMAHAIALIQPEEESQTS